MKAWISNFGQIPPPTPELSALERLKIDVQVGFFKKPRLGDPLYINMEIS